MRTTRRTPGWRAAAAVTTLLAVVAIGGPPAAAHGGGGVIEVGDPELVGPLQVEFPIRVTYENDGHPAEDVEGLSVTGSGPDGATLGPLDPFVEGDAPGVHRATLTFPTPGTWELTIGIDEPASTATLTVDVDELTAPDAGGDRTGTTEVDGPESQEDPDTVIAPTPTDTADDAAAAAAADAARDGTDEGGVPLIVLVVGFVIAVVAGVAAYRMFRSQTTAAG